MKTNTVETKDNKAMANIVYLKYDISKIEIDTNTSIRHEYTDESLNELAESIKANNNELIQPIVISRIGKSDKYRVVAGRRRFLACRDILKLKYISAIVINYENDIAEFTAQFAENEERQNWTDYDYVKAIQMVQAKKPGIKQEEIAKVFNKSIDWTRKKMQHLNTVKDLDATSHSKVPTSLIIELTRLSPEARKEALHVLSDKAETKELPTVKEFRKEIKENSIPVKKPKAGEITLAFLTYDSKKEDFVIHKDLFVTKGVYADLKKITEQEVAEIIKNSKTKLEQVHSVYKYQSSVEFDKDSLLYENKNHELIKNGKTESVKIFYFDLDTSEEDAIKPKSISAKFPYLENLKIFDVKKGHSFYSVRNSVGWNIYSDTNANDITESIYGIETYKVVGSDGKLYYHDQALDRLANPNEHGFIFNENDVCMNAKKIFSCKLGNAEFLIAEAQDKDSFYTRCELNGYYGKERIMAFLTKGDRKTRILNCITTEAKAYNYGKLSITDKKKLHTALFEFLRKEFSEEFKNFSDDVLLFYLEKYSEKNFTEQKFESEIKSEIAKIRNDISSREKAVLSLQNFLTTKRVGSDTFQLYETWKNTGKVSEGDKKKVLEFLKERKNTTQKEVNAKRKEYQSIEKDHIDIANDINLLEDEMLFEPGVKVKKTAGKK